MKKPIMWTCTDPDLHQYGRKMEEEGHYEFKEFDRVNYPDEPGTYDSTKDFIDATFDNEEMWIHKVIKIEDYTLNELKDIVGAYYSDREVTEMLQFPDDDAMWIVAECVFEQESGLY